jgi:hypothetical protein
MRSEPSTVPWIWLSRTWRLTAWSSTCLSSSLSQIRSECSPDLILLSLLTPSCQVARQFPYLFESSIVLAYQTYLGGRVSEKLREKSLQERQGLLDDSVPLAQRLLSYFSLYSLLLFIGTAPLGVQRFVVHTLQPFAVAGIARLLSIVATYPWLSFIPITLGLSALLYHLYRTRENTRRQQSKVFSASQRGEGGSSIQYRRKTEIQSAPREATNVDHDLETGQGAVDEEPPSAIELRCVEALRRPLGGSDDEDNESKDSNLSPPLPSRPSHRGHMLAQPSTSNASAKSRTRASRRPSYRGMFSLPDDDEADQAALQKIKRRRAGSSRRQSIDRDQQEQRRKSSLTRPLSTFLRMISMTDDSEERRQEEKQREAVVFDDPDEELSDFESFSSGSRYDYSSEDGSSSTE